MDEEIETVLRKIQAEEMTRTNRATSFSYIINQILKESVKEHKINSVFEKNSLRVF